jgi:general secretion pathway protein N
MIRNLRLPILAAIPIGLVCLTGVAAAQNDEQAPAPDILQAPAPSILPVPAPNILQAPAPNNARAPAPKIVQAAPPQTPAIPPLDELQATRERPLFSANRRPPSVQVEPEALPPIVESASLPFNLTGVALGPDIRVAILRNKDTNEEVRLREGEKINPWTVDVIAERYVVLRGDGKRVRLWLFSNTSKSGAQAHRVGDTDDSTTTAAPGGGGVDEEVVPNEPAQVRPPAPPPQQPGPPRQRRPPRRVPPQQPAR